MKNDVSSFFGAKLMLTSIAHAGRSSHSSNYKVSANIMRVCMRGERRMEMIFGQCSDGPHLQN